MSLIEEIQADLKKKLSKDRYQHSLMVASQAKDLAKYYHYDLEKAYVAGLIHDIAKEFTKEENRKWLMLGGLSEELLSEVYEKMIHADIGAVYVEKVYNLNQDICNAIKYHTIGNVSMNLLAKIIFIADKIGRKELSKKLKEIKKLAYQDLDKAIEEYLLYQKERFERQGINLHPESIKLLNKIIKSHENILEE